MAALVAMAGCASTFDADEDMQPEDVGTAELAIRAPEPAAPCELLGLGP